MGARAKDRRGSRSRTGLLAGAWKQLSRVGWRLARPWCGKKSGERGIQSAPQPRIVSAGTVEEGPRAAGRCACECTARSGCATESRKAPRLKNLCGNWKISTSAASRQRSSGRKGRETRVDLEDFMSQLKLRPTKGHRWHRGAEAAGCRLRPRGGVRMEVQKRFFSELLGARGQECPRHRPAQRRAQAESLCHRQNARAGVPAPPAGTERAQAESLCHRQNSRARVPAPPAGTERAQAESLCHGQNARARVPAPPSAKARRVSRPRGCACLRGSSPCSP
jgi:hypothetical protein